MKARIRKTSTCANSLLSWVLLAIHNGCCLRTAGLAWLLPMLLLAEPATLQAGLNYTTNNGTITITGFTGSAGAVTIPGTINGFPVTDIGDYAFDSRTDLTSVTITVPVATQRVSNEVFTVAGKVKDNGPVAGVYCQLNGGEWAGAEIANDLMNWTATVMLNAGSNTLSAYAEDAAGNRSVTNKVNFVYVPVVGRAVVGLVTPLQFSNMAVANGSMQLQLIGTPGQPVVVESSADLVHWKPIQTNSVPPEGVPLPVPINQSPAQFFRVRTQ